MQPLLTPENEGRQPGDESIIPTPEEGVDQITGNMKPVLDALRQGAVITNSVLQSLARGSDVPRLDLTTVQSGDRSEFGFLADIIEPATTSGSQQIEVLNQLDLFVQRAGTIPLSWILENPGALSRALDMNWPPEQPIDEIEAEEIHELAEPVTILRDHLGIYGQEGAFNPIIYLLAANRPALQFLPYWEAVTWWGAKMTIDTYKQMMESSGIQEQEQDEQLSHLAALFEQAKAFDVADQAITEKLSNLTGSTGSGGTISDQVRNGVSAIEDMKSIQESLKAKDALLPIVTEALERLGVLTGSAATRVQAKDLKHEVVLNYSRIATKGLLGIQLSVGSLVELTLAQILSRLNLQASVLDRALFMQKSAIQTAVENIARDTGRLLGNSIPKEK